MKILIEISEAVICRPHPASGLESKIGAVAEFYGIVRGEENGRPISSLHYEAYQPMAENVMRQILEELDRNHPCHAATVIHRIGLIPVGETAIYVGIASAHRGEAFAVLRAFMDRLKQDVPVWKTKAS